MTSKQRAYLKSLAMTMDPILQIGKSSVTPELTAAVAEALEARELIKLHVLQNCGDDLRGMAEILAGGTCYRKKNRSLKRGKRRQEENRSSLMSGV